MKKSAPAQASPKSRRLRVIFVAGLVEPKGGARGGQLTVARTLMGGRLSADIEWIPIDSSAPYLPPPPLVRRFASAAKRVLDFTLALPRADAALIFTSNGASILEKGVMACLARLTGRGVVVRLASGAFARDMQRPFWRQWIQLTCKAASIIVCQGSTWVRLFEEIGVPAGKIQVIPNPVIPQPAAVRRRGDGGPTRIIYVGWMIREKGVPEILEIARRLEAAGHPVEVRLLGEGGNPEELRSWIEATGGQQRTRVYGWVHPDQVGELLRDSDLFLFPSHSEGLPNAVLEAMAAGLPIVATRVGSLPDWFEGILQESLHEVGDVDAMTATCLRLLEDAQLARSLSDAGRRVISDHFAPEEVESLFLQCIRRSTGSRSEASPSPASPTTR